MRLERMMSFRMRAVRASFFGFACGKEALVEDFEDGVVARGYQGGPPPRQRTRAPLPEDQSRPSR